MDANVTILDFWEVRKVGSLYKIRALDGDIMKTVAVATEKPCRLGNFLRVSYDQIVWIYYLDDAKGKMKFVCKTDNCKFIAGDAAVFEYEGIYYVWRKDTLGKKLIRYPEQVAYADPLGKQICETAYVSENMLLSILLKGGLVQKKIRDYGKSENGWYYIDTDGQQHDF